MCRTRLPVSVTSRVAVGFWVKRDVFFGQRVVDCVVEVDSSNVNLLSEVGLLLRVEVFFFSTAFEALQLLSRRLAV